MWTRKIGDSALFTEETIWTGNGIRGDVGVPDKGHKQV
jgi:hypothetical protein